MPQFDHDVSESSCPFINLGDPRCDKRLRLGRLGEAFDVCLNHYDACPTHQRLCHEQRVRITIDGQAARHAFAPDIPTTSPGPVRTAPGRLRLAGS